MDDGTTPELYKLNFLFFKTLFSPFYIYFHRYNLTQACMSVHVCECFIFWALPRKKHIFSPLFYTESNFFLQVKIFKKSFKIINFYKNIIVWNFLWKTEISPLSVMMWMKCNMSSSEPSGIISMRSSNHDDSGSVVDSIAEQNFLTHFLLVESIRPNFLAILFVLIKSISCFMYYGIAVGKWFWIVAGKIENLIKKLFVNKWAVSVSRK